jgi:hypothetical protein
MAAMLVDRLKASVAGFVTPYRDNRRPLYVGVASLVLVLALVILARLTWLSPVVPAGDTVPAYIASLQNIADNIAAAIVVSASIILLVAIATPTLLVKEDIAVLSPWLIRTTLGVPLATTREYWFRGRSGRYFRHEVLPALDRAGRKENASRQISAFLPNPCDEKTLEHYARYRNSLSDSHNTTFTSSSIKVEILATILSLIQYAKLNAFMQPRIVLCQGFTLFRTDLSDEYVVLTREEKSWPAFISSKGTKFFDSIKEEMRLELEWGATIEIPESVETPIRSADIVRNTVDKIDALNGINLSSEECEQIVSAIARPQDPYG